MDTSTEIEKEEYNSEHLFMCGTCKYWKKTRCRNFISDDYEELVDESCSCDLYVPKKGMHII